MKEEKTPLAYSHPREAGRTPPAFSHPLGEGEKIIPLSEGVVADRGSSSLAEGAVADHGRPLGTEDVVVNGCTSRIDTTAIAQVPLHLKLYNSNLQPRANALRKRMTKAEACLWKYVLRAGMMRGYTFNRQRPVLKYIADFMCKPLQLIIEVDGSSHDNPDAQKYDAIRQRELEESGFIVIRFTNAQVLKAIHFVQSEISKKIDEIELSRHIIVTRRMQRYANEEVAS